MHRGFLVSPVAELHDEQQASHGIELFGRPPHLRIEVFGQLSCRHQLQNGLPQDMLPAKSTGALALRHASRWANTTHFAKDFCRTCVDASRFESGVFWSDDQPQGASPMALSFILDSLTRSVSEGILGENIQPKPLADASGYKVSAAGLAPHG